MQEFKQTNLSRPLPLYILDLYVSAGKFYIGYLVRGPDSEKRLI